MVQEPDAPDTHDHDDNCVCDIALDEDEATSDSDLPVTSGGVATARGHEGSDDADGCDLDFTDGESTADEDLPVATGGVG